MAYVVDAHVDEETAGLRREGDEEAYGVELAGPPQIKDETLGEVLTSGVLLVHTSRLDSVDLA